MLGKKSVNSKDNITWNILYGFKLQFTYIANVTILISLYIPIPFNIPIDIDCLKETLSFDIWLYYVWNMWEINIL